MAIKMPTYGFKIMDFFISNIPQGSLTTGMTDAHLHPLSPESLEQEMETPESRFHLIVEQEVGD